ncbi:MAG: hypothetical protein WC517_01215 [Patescibacteria group bacterium]
MICFNCKRQIPDNVPNCPNCGAPINPPVQIGQEIRVRRWQRWIFYVIFIILFLSSVAFAVYVYAQNTELLNASIDLKNSLTKTQSDLVASQASLSGKDTQLSQLQQDIAAKQALLDQKLAEVQAVSLAKEKLTAQYDQFNSVLSAVNANTFNALIQMGVGVSFKDLARVPVADYNLGVGADIDTDGLSDLAEAAFGTDPRNADTDSDGYNDKQEIINGYDPLSKTDKYPIDLKFTAAQKGKILLSVQGQNEAWYVNPKDNKRYFLGRPADAVKAMEGVQTAAATTTRSVSQ